MLNVSKLKGYMQGIVLIFLLCYVANATDYQIDFRCQGYQQRIAWLYNGNSGYLDPPASLSCSPGGLSLTVRVDDPQGWKFDHWERGQQIFPMRQLTFNINYSFDLVAVFTQDLPPPDPPTLTSPSNGATVSSPIMLVWSSQPRATLYTLQISRNSSFSDLFGEQTVPGTSLSVSNISSGQYFWRVNAMNQNGASAWSSPVRLFNINSVEPPAVPVLISPTNNATVSSNSVQLSWNPAARAENYRIQTSSKNDFSTVIDDFYTTSSSALMGNLINGNQYWWRVLSHNSAGNSDWSEIRKFQVSIKEYIKVSISSNISKPVLITLDKNDKDNLGSANCDFTRYYEKSSRISVTGPVIYKSPDNIIFYLTGAEVNGAFQESSEISVTLDKDISIKFYFSNSFDISYKAHNYNLKQMADFRPYTDKSFIGSNSIIELIFGKKQNTGYPVILLQGYVDKLIKDCKSIQDAKYVDDILKSVVLGENSIIKGFLGDLNITENNSYKGGISLGEQCVGYSANLLQTLTGAASLRLFIDKQPDSWSKKISIYLLDQFISTIISGLEFFATITDNSTVKSAISPSRFLKNLYFMDKYKFLNLNDVFTLGIDHLYKPYTANLLMYEEYINKSQFLVSKLQEDKPNGEYQERLLANSQALSSMRTFHDDMCGRYKVYEKIESLLNFGYDVADLAQLPISAVIGKLIEFKTILYVRLGDAMVNFFSAVYSHQRLVNIDTGNSGIVGSWTGMVRDALYVSFKANAKSIINKTKEIQKELILGGSEPDEFENINKEIENLNIIKSQLINITPPDTAGIWRIAEKLQNNSAIKNGIYSVLDVIKRTLIDKPKDYDIADSISLQGNVIILESNNLSMDLINYYIYPTQVNMMAVNNGIALIIKHIQDFKALCMVFLADKSVLINPLQLSAICKFMEYSLPDSAAYELNISIKNLSGDSLKKLTIQVYDDLNGFYIESIPIKDIANDEELNVSEIINLGKTTRNINLTISIIDSLNQIIQNDYELIDLIQPDEYKAQIVCSTYNLKTIKTVLVQRIFEASDGLDFDDILSPPNEPNSKLYFTLDAPYLKNRDGNDYIQESRSSSIVENADIYYMNIEAAEDFEMSFILKIKDYIAILTDLSNGKIYHLGITNLITKNDNKLSFMAGKYRFMLSIGRKNGLITYPGWIMLSFPTQDSIKISDIIPYNPSLTRDFRYNTDIHNYELISIPLDFVNKNEGIWHYLNSESPYIYFVSFDRFYKLCDTIQIPEGPVMIGPQECPINLDSCRIIDYKTNRVISFRDAVALGLVVNYAFAWDNKESAYIMTKELNPFKGYWIIAKRKIGLIVGSENENYLSLCFGATKKEKIEVDIQKLKMTFENPDTTSKSSKSIIYCIISPQSSDGYDPEFDVIAPPDPPYVQFLAYLLINGDKSNEKLMQEGKTKDVTFRGIVDIYGKFNGDKLLVKIENNFFDNYVFIINGKTFDLNASEPNKDIIIDGVEKGKEYDFVLMPKKVISIDNPRNALPYAIYFLYNKGLCLEKVELSTPAIDWVLYDVRGNTLENNHISRDHIINLKNMVPGVYFIRFNTSNGENKIIPINLYY
jgi:hypothetical protein